MVLGAGFPHFRNPKPIAKTVLLFRLRRVRSPPFISSPFPMDTATDVAPTETTTKPLKVFRDGALSVAIFPNRVTVRDKDRTFHSASPERSYKDGDGYKSTHRLGKDDIPAMRMLLGQAWAWMNDAEAADRAKRDR